MKHFLAALCTLIIACLFSFAGATLVQAQASGKTATVPQFRYNAAEEVTLSGTVARVLTSPDSGMMAGAHVVLKTPSGLVDASLGRFAFEGKDAITLAAGEQVEARGVMRTIKDRQVLVVRTVAVKGDIYLIRNERGLALSPQARERASKKMDENGGTL